MPQPRTTPLLIALLGLLFPLTSSADDEAALAEIRRLYTAIEEATPLTVRKLEFDVASDPLEGSITYRTYPDGLSSIALSYVSGDHGGSDQYFYFHEDGLFFVFEEGHSWRFGPRQADGQPGSLDTLRERRFYFRTGACFRALSREAESADAEKLKAMVTKLPNEVIEPGKEARLLFRRALALRGVSTSEEAAAYFSHEWESP